MQRHDKIDLLPTDIYLKIMSYLTTKDFCAVFVLCKTTQVWFDNPEFLRKLFIDKFPDLFPLLRNKPIDFKAESRLAEDKSNFPMLYFNATLTKIAKLNIHEKTAIEKLLNYIEKSNPKGFLQNLPNNFFSNVSTVSHFFVPRKSDPRKQIAAAILKAIILNDSDEKLLDPFLDIIRHSDQYSLDTNSLLSTIYDELMEVGLISSPSTQLQSHL